MNKSAKRLMAALAVFGGALGTIFLARRRTETTAEKHSRQERAHALDRWARPGMSVTFRAELMPGRSRTERTHRVARLLPSGRVVLEDFAGEHTETEFESIH